MYKLRVVEKYAHLRSRIGFCQWTSIKRHLNVLGVEDPDAPLHEKLRKYCDARGIGHDDDWLPWDHYAAAAGGLGGADEKVISDHLAVASVIRSYQVRGHLVAALDPMGIMFTDRNQTISAKTGTPPDTIQGNYRLNPADLERHFLLPPTTKVGGGSKTLPLKEIIKRLELIYCRYLGAEYMHIHNVEQCNWIRQELEPPGALELPKELRKQTLIRLIRTHELEMFFSKKWPSTKRFGLEGLCISIPAMGHILDTLSAGGVEGINLAMAHRGRVNFLVNVCRKTLKDIFCQFENLPAVEEAAGDMKYHLGCSVDRIMGSTKKKMKITVIANPSHLELSTPVAMGKTSAEQFELKDVDGKKVMTFILHGDNAFCGQGICFESIQITHLPCFDTHGVFHLVKNNQIGFTTESRFAKTSRYSSDLGKVVEAPIFHVNADDPDTVIKAAEVLAKFRQKFGKDVILDIVGYRRYGHQEQDEPRFTNPLMYKKIDTMKPVKFQYEEALIKDGTITAAEAKQVADDYIKLCDSEFAAAKKETSFRLVDWLDTDWNKYFKQNGPLKNLPTGCKKDLLIKVGMVYSTPPPAEKKMVLHKSFGRILKRRLDLLNKGQFDLATAEALAFGTLCHDGFHVRLTGEDAERGTFGQRHHILHHQEVDGVQYCPLDHIFPNQARYTVCNSNLSEYALLGFEVGYSMHSPYYLVIWEAQYGDFSNVAQAQFDQMISASETKWYRQMGLVVNLPHGYDGAGPEHSSARVERFLQMVYDDFENIPDMSGDFAMNQLASCNWILVMVSTPANLFHMYRRQMCLPFRKPLIQFSHKAMFRIATALSDIKDIEEGSQFVRLIPESGPAAANPGGVKKLVFCSGQCSWEYRNIREQAKKEPLVAISTIEQLSPFPYDLVKAEIAKYPNAQLVWAQEEPRNYGMYTFMKPRIELIAQTRKVKYVGRPISVSPAVGSLLLHKAEAKKMKEDFLSGL